MRGTRTRPMPPASRMSDRRAVSDCSARWMWSPVVGPCSCAPEAGRHGAAVLDRQAGVVDALQQRACEAAAPQVARGARHRGGRAGDVRRQAAVVVGVGRVPAAGGRCRDQSEHPVEAVGQGADRGLQAAAGLVVAHARAPEIVQRPPRHPGHVLRERQRVVDHAHLRRVDDPLGARDRGDGLPAGRDDHVVVGCAAVGVGDASVEHPPPDPRHPVQRATGGAVPGGLGDDVDAAAAVGARVEADRACADLAQDVVEVLGDGVRGIGRDVTGVLDVASQPADRLTRSGPWSAVSLSLSL
jgi:hypothetical protein